MLWQMDDLPSQFGEQGGFGFICYLIDTFILCDSFSSLWSNFDFIKASPTMWYTLEKGDGLASPPPNRKGRLLSALCGAVNRRYRDLRPWVIFVIKDL